MMEIRAPWSYHRPWSALRGSRLEEAMTQPGSPDPRNDRVCTDHIVVLGEAHLRRTLREYARDYNTARTHRSLEQDAPVSRPVQRFGRIVSHAVFGGLHHQYVRI